MCQFLIVMFYTQFYRIKGENMGKNKFSEICQSVHKIAKFKYFAKVITYSKSPYHVLQSYI